MESSVAELPSPSTTPSVKPNGIKILTFLIDEEWALYLHAAGFEVSLLVTIMHQRWNHQKHAMPSGIKFVSELCPFDHNLSIIPVGNILENGVDLELIHVFKQTEVNAKLPCLLVYWSKEKDQEKALEKGKQLASDLLNHPHMMLKGPAKGLYHIAQPLAATLVKPKGFKMRWSVANHPAWLRHTQFVIHHLGADEASGDLIEMDCGDGPMISFLHGRLAKCRCVGLCLHGEEKKVANHTDPSLHVVVGDAEDVKKREPDYILVTDVPYPLALEHRAIAETAKKKALMTINKQDHELPPPWEILTAFKGWELHESLSHYLLVKPCV